MAAVSLWERIWYVTDSEATKYLTDVVHHDRDMLNFVKKPSGMSVLHACAIRGHTQTCQALLDDPCFDRANHVNDWGLTGLHYASRKGHRDVILSIIRSKRFTALFQVGTNGTTAEDDAANEFCRLIIRQEIEERCKGLWHKAWNVKSNAEDLLDTEEQIAFDYQDDAGLTVLHACAMSGNAFVCEALLADHRFKKADNVNKWGLTALHYAARSGHREVIQKLIRNTRFTALLHVGINGTTAEEDAADDFCRHIIRQGIEERKKILWHRAWSPDRSVEDVLAIADQIAFDYQDDDGLTVLHACAMSGHALACEALLADCRFKKVDEVNKWGLTALHYAARSGHHEIVQKIIRCTRFTAILQVGANGTTAEDDAADDLCLLAIRQAIEDRRKIIWSKAWSPGSHIGEALAAADQIAFDYEDEAGNNVLHACAMNNNPIASRAILVDRRFTKAENTNIWGMTALHYAARFGFEDVCSVLLASPRFTNVSAKSASGKTAIDEATSPYIRAAIAERMPRLRFTCSGHESEARCCYSTKVPVSYSAEFEVCD